MRFLRPDLLRWSLVIPVLVASAALHWRLTRAFRRRAAIDRRFASLSNRTTARRDIAVIGAPRRCSRIVSPITNGRI